MATLIETAKAFLGRGEDDVRRALGKNISSSSDDEYESLDGLTSLENPAVFPGTLYLLDGAVELVYLGEDAVSGITPAKIEDEVKGRPARLRSRAGKKASTYVHADDGVAYSAEGDEVHYIEVFRPRTRKEYEDRDLQRAAGLHPLVLREESWRSRVQRLAMCSLLLRESGEGAGG